MAWLMGWMHYIQRVRRLGKFKVGQLRRGVWGGYFVSGIGYPLVLP